MVKTKLWGTVLVGVTLWLIGSGTALSWQAIEADKAGKSPEKSPNKQTVELRLKVHDTASGFTLEAKKQVPHGISGFDGLRNIVNVKSKQRPGMGVFVQELCGVKPPPGQFWALYADGELSDRGISSIKLNDDMLIEWKTEEPNL